MELRPYQKDMVEAVRVSYRNGKCRPCLVLPCGGGKSCIVADMAKRVTDKGNFVLFIVHRIELCQQITDTFTTWGVNMDLCLIGMVQSIKKKFGIIPKPSLLIFDENHHVLAKTYLDVINYYSDVKSIGVTATPTRLNGGGLGDVCDDLITGVSTKWLIKNGYLAPYKYYSVPVSDFADISVNRGEYNHAQLSEIMENGKIYGDTISNYKRLADGTKTIAYCASVKSAYDTAEEFRRQGYVAEALDGKSDKNRRSDIMERFRCGEVMILCNADLFGEGIDISDCETVLLLRKTKSLTLYIQQAMRCMRIDKNNPNKVAKIIDHVGNVFEHGLIDEDRQWTLDPAPKKSDNEIKIKPCPTCYAVITQNTLICPYCEHDFTVEVNARLEKERIDAELEEIKAAELKRLQDTPMRDMQFKTWDDLVEYQQAKKYKFFWCLRAARTNGIDIPGKYKHLMHMVK